MAHKKMIDGPQIPSVTWNIVMIWDLVLQIKKPAHLKVLFGIKEDSYDVKVYYTQLKDCYVKLAAKLKQTGGGLKDGEGSDIGDDSSDVVIDFYISLDGPDENTPESACNLFEQLTNISKSTKYYL
ncbi:hypothetical protein V8B97DRAFT_2111370 [Scleroderma yunnanense]